jgi:hypothetical protein
VPSCFSFNPFEASRYAPTVDGIDVAAQIVSQNAEESIAVLRLPLLVVGNCLRDVLIDRFGEPGYLRGAACETIVGSFDATVGARTSAARYSAIIYTKSNPDSILSLR